MATLLGNVDAHNRFVEAYDYLMSKGVIHKQQDVADAMAISKSAISEARANKNDRIGEKFLRRFAAAYSDHLNEDWLLTGKGQMEKADPNATRPHIPASVAAGFSDVALTTVMESDATAEPLMPFIPDYDFTVNVSGDSMEPELHDGDKIACRWMDPSDTFKPNRVYLLDTREGAVVKYVERSGSILHCSSLNPAYDPFTIDTSSVIRAAQVIAAIHQL